MKNIKATIRIVAFVVLATLVNAMLIGGGVLMIVGIVSLREFWWVAPLGTATWIASVFLNKAMPSESHRYCIWYRLSN